MKKFTFGILLTIIGLVFSAACFIYAMVNPYDYNGMTGLLASFLGTGTLKPFLLSMLVLLAGLVICWYEAYRRK